MSEYTTLKVGAEDNTIKIWLNIDEEAPKEEVEQYKGEDGTKTLKNMGTYFLTSSKPETRALSGTVKIKVKQGDETVNYVKMSYRDAKKFEKEMQKEAEEAAEAEEAEGDADAAAEDAADEAADEAAEGAAEETEDAAE
jgi:hypothetical protein